MESEIKNKPLNIIISGLDVFDRVLDRYNDATESLDRRLPELEKKRKIENIIIVIAISLCLLALIISVILTDVTEDDAVYYYSFISFFANVILILVLSIAVEKRMKNRPNIKLIREENENNKKIVDAISDQKNCCLKLLDIKNELLDSRIIKDNNGYDLEYSFTEDGDTVLRNYIYIDVIESSLKQTGASLVITEDNKWRKGYNMALYIEYNLYKEIYKEEL